MKKKILMAIGIIIFMITMVGAFLTISNGTTDWFIERDEEQGISWYYELVDGEAVNVRTTGGNAKYLTKLVVPETLGGYPVTSVRGKDNIRDAMYGLNPGNILESQPYYIFSTPIYKNYYLKEVVLPDTIREIGAYCFDNLLVLEKINIPASLERIGTNAFEHDVSLKEIRFENPNNEFIDIDKMAFQYGKVEKLVINNIETWKHDIMGDFQKVEIGENVKHINGHIYCAEDADIHIPSTVQSFCNTSFMHATDIWVDNEEENVEVENAKLPGNAWVHFNNKEKILTNLPAGIKAINTATNEEFTTIKVPTGSDFSFKLEQQDGYNYDKYTIIIEGYTQKLAKTVTKLDLRFGQEYTIENITRDKTIYLETRENKLDLSLRQYIWGANDVELIHSRAPVTEINEDRTIKYKHTKQSLYPKKGNKLRYGIRVYNEGLEDGSANKITEYIPEGLRFDETSEINAQYGWVKSADGRSATTEYLRDNNIEAITIYNKINYKEIFIELVVDAEENEEFTRLVTVAEISEASSIDTDSIPGNIQLPINSDFMKEESESSNANSIVKCVEDDMDFENISLSRKVMRPYTLTLNKIDGMDNQLLNGATFDLMDENKNVLKTGVTANGGIIDFGTIYAYGDKKTRYYIKETNTPEGYNNHIQFMVRLDVVPPKEDLVQAEDLKFEIDMHSIDVDTSKYEEIEINTKEQLRAIQNNLDKKYVLTQDIDLEGEDWEPLNVENVMLDGKGHSIKNLTINKSVETSKKIGLFGTYSGIIENLTLENVDLKATKELTVPQEDKTKEEMDSYLDGIYNSQETENEIPAVGGIIAYSDNVILKNCKVTGSVKTEYKNVGGLVGHSKKNTIAVFRDCVNEAVVEAKKEYTFNQKRNFYDVETNAWINDTINVTAREGRNAGGIIGVTLGPVYISNSVNKGNIYSGRYNAGGMIGTAEHNEYILNNVFGKYNEDLNIYVKNERINGKYNIKLKKVDETGNNLLAGAKFSIYDRNKNIIDGYENVELTNGELELPEKIFNIGTDTFYIKETEAPAGYVQLTDTYIKVEIEKTWDRENQKYETKVESKALTTTEMQNDIPKEHNTSTVATGSNIDNTDNYNVVLKTNDVTIDENSKNEGMVTSENINAGGFVGRATCGVEVVDSVNNGEVQAHVGNDAGVVGQIEVEENKNALLYVNNVQNNAKVSQKQLNNIKAETKVENYASAGIAGTVNCDVEIYNTTNNGEINAQRNHIGGLLGATFSDYVTVENSINNGNVQITTDYSSYGAGGIIGQSFSYYKLDFNGFIPSGSILNEHSICKLTNCENKGYVTGANGAGGLIGNSCDRQLYLNNCKCENVDITMKNTNGCVGGIIAQAFNQKLVVENCLVNNLNVDKGFYGTGGIVGLYGHSFNSTEDSGLTMKNCKVENSSVNYSNGSYGSGGIIGNIQESPYVQQRGFNVLIEGCNLVNTIINSNASQDFTGGIVGTAYTSSSDDIIINVKDCSVTGGEIKNSSSRVNTTIGGIMGIAKNVSTNITGCKVNGTKFDFTKNDYNNSGYDDRDHYNLSGIIGYSSEKNSTITDCEVKGVEFKTDCAKVGGIGGTVGDESPKLIVARCLVDDINIINNNQTNSNSQGFSAGIIAYASAEENEISNCTISNSKITSKQTNSAGAISVAIGKNKFNNILVDNVEFLDTEDRETQGSRSNYGGIVAYANGPEAIFDNCTIKDSSVKIKGAQLGGIAGFVNSNNTVFKNCEVNNSILEQLERENEYRQPCAGIVAASYRTTYFENCKLTNGSKVIGRGSLTSGIAGWVGSLKQSGEDSKRRIVDCKIEDSEVISKSTKTSNNGCTSGIIAVSDENIDIFERCSINNATLESNNLNIGGFVGALGATNTTLEECTVNNLTINNINSVNENVNNKIAVGGVIAVSGYSSSKLNINNSSINNITINVENNSRRNSLGGIAGELYSLEISPNTEISGITINKLNSSLDEYVGGLVGFVKNNTTLNNLKISNIDINSNGNVGGLFGTDLQYSDLEYINGSWTTVIKEHEIIIDGLELSNINIKNGNHAGGIIGDAKKITVTNTNLTDVNVNSKYIAGGLVGRAQTDTISGYTYPSRVLLNNIEFKTTVGNTNTVSGINAGTLVGIANEVLMPQEGETSIIINNTKTTASGDICGLIGLVLDINNYKNITLNNCVNQSNSNAGGIIGLCMEQSDYSLENITLTNVKIISKGNAGGVLAMSPYGNQTVTLKNITANGLTIDCSESSGGGNVGGLIGKAQKANLDTINVTDLNVTHKESYNTGGLIGILTNGSSELKNINITSTNGKTNQIIANTTSNSNSNSTGIILGFGVGVNTSNISINNTLLDGGRNHHIGTIGALEGNGVITGITLDNVTITGKGNGNGIKLGGIVGMTKEAVTSCTVINSNIYGTDPIGTEDRQYFDVGGIVGIMPVENSTTVKIDNCTVEKTTISSQTGYNGGIAGFTCDLISNSTVKQSNIINTGTDKTATGGIVGHSSNISGQDTTIKNSKVIDSNITGNNKVGGISGGAVYSIKNCYVGKDENETLEEGQYAVTITGKDAVGAIIGDAGEIQNESYFMLEMTDNSVNNTLITRNNAEGSTITDIDKMIGEHNRFSTSYTGDTTRTETLMNNTIDANSIVINAE